jgi:hypothetical protein
MEGNPKEEIATSVRKIETKSRRSEINEED